MRLTQPKIPSERDIDIYEMAYVHDHKQTVIAAKYHLSQSRVSRILATVVDWVAVGKPGAKLKPDNAMCLAIDIWQRKLSYFEKRADDAFTLTCQPAPVAPPVAENNYKQAAPKPIRPDVKLLAQAVALAEKQYALTAIASHAQNLVELRYASDALWQEDATVKQLLYTCRYVTDMHAKELKLGIDMPPLPPFDAQGIEVYIRNSLRQAKPERRVPHKQHLPPEWRAAVTATMDAPFPGSEAQVPPTSSTTASTTAPQPEHKQAYVSPNYIPLDQIQERDMCDLTLDEETTKSSAAEELVDHLRTRKTGHNSPAPAPANPPPPPPPKLPSIPWERNTDRPSPVRGWNYNV